MFWGISLEAGKRYSQTVEKSFHISMAALSANNTAKGSVTIMVEVEKASYPLCTLNPDRIPQQALDYVFTEGEEVLFYTEGDLEVHLTGYLIDDQNPVEYSSDEEVESASNSNVSSCNEEDYEENKTKKNKAKEESSEESLQSLISELEGLNEDNDGCIDVLLPRSARKKQKKVDVSEETVATQISLTGKLLDNGSEESEDDDDWHPGSKRKLSKKKTGKVEKNVKEEKKVNNGLSQEDKNEELNDCINNELLSPNSSKFKKKNSKDKLTNSSNEPHKNEDIPDERKTAQDQKTVTKDGKNELDAQNTEDKLHHGKKQLPGGTIIEDLVKGTGKKAKKGKQVSVYYKGSLKKSKNVFDECSSGEPFTFKLGEGEVIKGWDRGIEGMHVGGKRRLTVPPSLGYGSKPVGSNIPANSTLVFVVELLKVH